MKVGGRCHAKCLPLKNSPRGRRVSWIAAAAAAAAAVVCIVRTARAAGIVVSKAYPRRLLLLLPQRGDVIQ